MSLKNRLPNFQQIFAVYGIIVLIFYGWTLIWFFWKLPSWDSFLTLGEMGTILAYSLATNLMESLLVLLMPLMMSFILPQSWFRDRFVSMASLLVLLGSGYIMYISKAITTFEDAYPKNLVRLIPVAGILIIGLVFLLDRIPFVRKVLNELADRATIFSYIFTSLGIVSFIVVLARNIF